MGERLVVSFHVNLEGDVTEDISDLDISDLLVVFEFQIWKEFLAGGDFFFSFKIKQLCLFI